MMGILHQSRGKGNAAARTLGETMSASRATKQLEDSAVIDQIHDISQRPQFSGLSGELGVASSQLPIQAKLTIGPRNDRYEQEADRVASLVVQQINAPASVQSSQGQSVQRSEAPEEEEIQAKPEKSSIQGMEAVAGREASTDLETAINSARGRGQPLEAGLQRSMGQAMGADFSGVKVHTEAQADQLNRSVQAKAFTTGHDVFFRHGAYAPGSRGGQELIAHELTHVVQQMGGGNIRNEGILRRALAKTKLNVVGENHEIADQRGRELEKQFCKEETGSTKYWEEYEFREKESLEEVSEGEETHGLADPMELRLEQCAEFARVGLNELWIVAHREEYEDEALQESLWYVNVKEGTEIKAAWSHYETVVQTMRSEVARIMKEKTGQAWRENNKEMIGKWEIEIKKHAEELRDIGKRGKVLIDELGVIFDVGSKLYKQLKETRRGAWRRDRGIDEIREMRSLRMHEAANGRASEGGVWKVGDDHAKDMARLVISGADLRFALTDEEKFAGQFEVWKKRREGKSREKEKKGNT